MDHATETIIIGISATGDYNASINEIATVSESAVSTTMNTFSINYATIEPTVVRNKI